MPTSGKPGENAIYKGTEVHASKRCALIRRLLIVALQSLQ